MKPIADSSTTFTNFAIQYSTPCTDLYIVGIDSLLKALNGLCHSLVGQRLSQAVDLAHSSHVNGFPYRLEHRGLGIITTPSTSTANS